MIEILDLKAEDTFGYRLEGSVEKGDMTKAYDEIERKMERAGKLNFYMEVRSLHFSDFSKDALVEEIRRILRHPSILVNVAKGALVTDIGWLKKAFEVESALIPTFTGKTFSFGEEALALEWLKTDQREGHRLDITLPEMVETSALKVAAGFALGLLAAGIFNSRQRKAMGLGVLAGTFIVGIPLGIKVLNNNRQLLGD